ncbi:transposase [Streptomyces sp. NBC_00555]|uniref:transposase n=1 Tax=Streptomyces sp. NBC_00555 TaxID=2903662 RepID=UPI002255EB6A|nr:transposase [Streptomyces sp. NBC_00555]MCX5014991.1 transposase [Streptomyces sp. NBC_00555]
MPQDVREWLPPDHLCWKVLDVVDHLDLSEFVDSYRDDRQGRAAYPPQALIALLLYCYSKGIRSSRKIEQACFDDVGCRIITANRRVDHSTLARFVRRHREALKLLFVQVLAMCSRQRGLLDLTAVAVDGSPMDANASRDSNQRLQRLDRVISECEAEIDNMVAGSLQPDGGRDEVGRTNSDSDVVPNECPRFSRLLDRFNRAVAARQKLFERALPSAGEIRLKVEAAERMVARAEKRLATESEAHRKKLEKYAERTRADLAAGLRGANGRPPVPMEDKTVLVRQRKRLVHAQAWLERARSPRPAPSPTAQASLSDPDSRMMLCKRGGFVQGYNIQIACARRQLLLAIEVQDNPSDMTALVPMVNKTQVNCLAAGIEQPIQLWLADSGYASTTAFEALADFPLLVSVTSEAHQAGFEAKREGPRGGQHEMAARLATPLGKEQYRQRGALVEPGFAQLFQRFGRRLNYRGHDGVDTEIKLLGAVHNLSKLFDHKARTRS